MPTRIDHLRSTFSATSRRYRLLGVVVLIVLALIALATGIYLALGDGAPAGLTTVVLALMVVCALLSFGLLYVLFTIEQTFKAMRTTMPTDAAPAPRPTSSPLAATAPVAAPTIEYGRESRDVEILEGIGTVFSRRLARNDIATLDDLRNATVNRVAVAAQVGEPIAHRWKLMADLMIVRALDAQAAELLVLCGIESVEELAQETAETLVRKMRLVNQSHKTRIYPAELSVGIVEGWIQAAKAQAIPGNVSGRQRFPRGKTHA